MIVRNKIWAEIEEVDVFYRCAREYASVQRQIKFAYKIAILLLAALCVLFTKLEMPNYTLWSAILIFVSSVLKAFCTQIILSDKSIEELEELGVDFENCRLAYENLMEKFDNEELSEEKVIEELNKRSKNYNRKKSELNKLVLWIPFWVKRRLQKESDDYLLRVHHNQYR